MRLRENTQAESDEDAALMLRAKAGDQGAFAELYDRNARSVVNFVHRFVPDRARAEELSQEVFLKVYRSAGSYEPRAKFKTFLFRIAANHCLNERRRGEYRAQVREPEREDGDRPVEHAGPLGEGPDAALAGRDLERALGQALGELSDRERAAFAMCRFEGMAYRDIADALDASEAAVKSLIHRATVAVARKLTPLVGADPLAAARGK